MAELERGQRSVAFSGVASGVKGSPLIPPRGALSLKVDRIHGSIAINTTDATAWNVVVAVQRRVLQSPIGLVIDIANADLLWSKVVANADLGTPTQNVQINSFRVDETIGEKQGVTRAGTGNRGFVIIIEQDGSVGVVGIITIEYTITWPDSKRTRDLGRIRRMGLMN